MSDGCSQRTLMRRQAQQVYSILLCCAPSEFQNAARSNNLVPLRRLFDVVEGQDVDVIRTQIAQELFQFPFRISRAPGFELDADEDFAPSRAEFDDRLAHAVGLPAPIQQ